jgi:hypothetical protein
MKEMSKCSSLAILMALIVSSFTVLSKKVPDDSWFKLVDQAYTQNYVISNYKSEPFNSPMAFDPTKRTLFNIQHSSVCPNGLIKLCAVRIDYSIATGLDPNNLDKGDFLNDCTKTFLGYQMRN